MDAVLITENFEGVCCITLNRPHCMNAFDLELALALRDAIRAAHRDPGVSVLVIAGAGKHFCTGADVKRDHAIEARSGIDLLAVVQEAWLELREGGKPSIAAIAGHAAGAGLSVALGCDFIVADSTARFSAPFAGVGLVADCGILITLPERIGMGAVRDMVLMGTVKDATSAHAIGLVDELCEAGQLRERALAKAVALSRRAPLAIQATRRMLRRRHEEIRTYLREELETQRGLRKTKDAQEAIKAFIEKRPPVWSGS